MSDVVGTARVIVVPDVDAFDSALDAGITNGLQKALAQVQQLNKEMSKLGDSKSGTKKVQKDMEDLGKSTTLSAKEIKKANDSLQKSLVAQGQRRVAEAKKVEAQIAAEAAKTTARYRTEIEKRYDSARAADAQRVAEVRKAEAAVAAEAQKSAARIEAIDKSLQKFRIKQGQQRVVEARKAEAAVAAEAQKGAARIEAVNRSIQKFRIKQGQQRVAEAKKVEAQVAAEAEKAAKRTNASLDGVGARAGAVNRQLRRLAITFAAVFGVREISRFITGSIQAFADLEESVSKSGFVFEEFQGQVQAFASGAVESIGLSEQAALEAASTFGNVFTAFGFGEQSSAGLSVALTQLSGDIASFNNLAGGTEEAAIALRSGLTGEIEPLKRLGLAFNAAEVDAKAVQLGLVDQGETLTENQKILTRYTIILDRSKKAQGDFARTSENLANQQRILQANFQDTRAAIGEALAPFAQETVTELNALFPALERLAINLLPTLAETFVSLLPLLGSTIDLLNAATPIIEAFANVVAAIPTDLIVLAGLFLTIGKLAKVLAAGFVAMRAGSLAAGASAAVHALRLTALTIAQQGAAAGARFLGQAVAQSARTMSLANPVLLAVTAALTAVTFIAQRGEKAQREYNASFQSTVSILENLATPSQEAFTQAIQNTTSSVSELETLLNNQIYSKGLGPEVALAEEDLAAFQQVLTQFSADELEESLLRGGQSIRDLTNAATEGSSQTGEALDAQRTIIDGFFSGLALNAELAATQFLTAEDTLEKLGDGSVEAGKDIVDVAVAEAEAAGFANAWAEANRVLRPTIEEVTDATEALELALEELGIDASVFDELERNVKAAESSISSVMPSIADSFKLASDAQKELQDAIVEDIQGRPGGIEALQERRDLLDELIDAEREAFDVQQEIAQREQELQAERIASFNEAEEARIDAINTAEEERIRALEEAEREAQQRLSAALSDADAFASAVTGAAKRATDALGEQREALTDTLDALKESQEELIEEFSFTKTAAEFEAVAAQFAKLGEEITSVEDDIAGLPDEARVSLAQLNETIRAQVTATANFVSNIRNLIARGADDSARFFLSQGEAGAQLLAETVGLNAAQLRQQEQFFESQDALNQRNISSLEGIIDEIDGIEPGTFTPLEFTPLEAPEVREQEFRSAFEDEVKFLEDEIERLQDQITEIQEQDIAPDASAAIAAQQGAISEAQAFFDGFTNLSEAGFESYARFLAESGEEGQAYLATFAGQTANQIILYNQRNAEELTKLNEGAANVFQTQDDLLAEAEAFKLEFITLGEEAGQGYIDAFVAGIDNEEIQRKLAEIVADVDAFNSILTDPASAAQFGDFVNQLNTDFASGVSKPVIAQSIGFALSQPGGLQFRSEIVDAILAASNLAPGQADLIRSLIEQQFGFFGDGGIFTRATPGVMGEDGSEVLIPLTKPQRALDLAERSGLMSVLNQAQTTSTSTSSPGTGTSSTGMTIEWSGDVVVQVQGSASPADAQQIGTVAADAFRRRVTQAVYAG